MTDSLSFFRTVVAQVGQFVNAYENLQLLADRLAADSNLATEAANAAATMGRPDLTAANFTNLNLTMIELAKLLNVPNPNVPTGGELKLALYQIM